MNTWYFLSYLLILNLCFFNLKVLAQTTEEVLLVGGITTCRFSSEGEILVKKITSRESSLLIDSLNNKTEFTLDLESSSNQGEDINIHLFTPTADINTNSLLGGQRIGVQTDEAELEISKSNNDKITEVSNNILNENENFTLSSILIEITKIVNSLATGNIKVRFPETILKEISESKKTETNNGKVVVNCTFRRVPVTFKK